MRVGWSAWSIDILPEWENEDDPECLTIYHPNGVGALQLSSAKKQEGSVTQEDLDFHTKQEWGNPSKCTFGDFAGQAYKFVSEDSFWFWWILANGSVLLRASYNCEIQDKNVEIEEINNMLKTLKRE